MITVEAIRASQGFASFCDEDLDLLLGAAIERRFAPGEVLYQQGRPAVSCFMIVSGTVELVKEEPEGERPLTHLDPGAIVGQLGLVDREPRIATLRARTAVSALELTRDVFERLITSASPLGNRMLMELAVATGRQLREADRRLAALLERRHEVSARPRDRMSEIEAMEMEIRRKIGAPGHEPVTPSDVVEVTPEDRVRRR